jgi:hypothetical protein
VVSFPQISSLKPCIRLSIPHTRYMSRPSNAVGLISMHYILWYIARDFLSSG